MDAAHPPAVAPDLDAIRQRRAKFLQHGTWKSAEESADDVPALLDHIGRMSDVIRDLLRLSAVPADPPDEAAARERAEALLAKVPPRPRLATDDDLTTEVDA